MRPSLSCDRRLPDIAAIEALGTCRSVTAGDYLFLQGDRHLRLLTSSSPGEVEILVNHHPPTAGPTNLVVRHGSLRFVVEG